MGSSKAIESLKRELKKIPKLRTLPPDNKKFELFRYQVRDIIEVAFGKDSSEYKRIPIMPIKTLTFEQTDAERQQEYNEYLDSYEICLKSIIQKYETPGIEEKPRRTDTEPPKAFIAHGGETKARNKLQKFLIALGVIPFIIEEEPKEGRSVNEQVEYYSEQADCAIILGTADDKELKDGKLYPRRNVYIEIGRFQEKFPKRIIYLLEEGASFPSDISEKLYTPFTQESMDEAFTTIARELKKFGILKAVKPPNKEQKS